MVRSQSRPVIPFRHDALASNWQIACDIAAGHGRVMDPARLRLVGHIAETREKAFANAASASRDI